jgi:integrase/recombinase XerD
MKAYIEPEEVARMEKAAANPRDRLLVCLLFHLGCRISELLSITVNDLDFARGTVTILHLKTRLKINCPGCLARLGRKHTFCPNCGSRIDTAIAREIEHRRVRVLHLNDGAVDLLKEFINRGEPIRRGDKQLLFGINRHRAWQIITGCATRAGLSDLVNPETGRIHHISPHRLRDAFSVNAVKHDDSGDGLRMLQEQLGHASISTTMRYRKVAGEELRQWYIRLWEKSGK